ncbi:uncharacterized protein M421DRAFT_230169 [Didymella exigua CBS 183.55]|uniref:Uncharacterized protein n=1 Tax=Didymella exigua CBS 183.55 TaxID=1150837 RepID=A0A6A5RFE1_9PLEO|nr:uncharacterized protein M421DRAFT_230169 [Didymella exigua CBS 183.55]KAF1926010.1 hypothetical protein M421DRAFT_230169 [Didymella exigua CBS 183.55]
MGRVCLAMLKGWSYPHPPNTTLVVSWSRALLLRLATNGCDGQGGAFSLESWMIIGYQCQQSPRRRDANTPRGLVAMELDLEANAVVPTVSRRASVTENGCLIASLIYLAELPSLVRRVCSGPGVGETSLSISDEGKEQQFLRSLPFAARLTPPYPPRNRSRNFMSNSVCYCEWLRPKLRVVFRFEDLPISALLLTRACRWCMVG